MTTPKTAPDERAPFTPRASIESPDGTGARWWNQAMQVNAAGMSRRRAIALQLGLGGGVLVVGVVGGIIASKSDDDVESAMDALELQRRTSWNVGDVDRRLTLTDGRTNDADGSEIWRTALVNQRLAEVLAPGEARLQPYYAPSLFQAPDQSADLRMDLTPMLRASMEDFYDRGRALGEAFTAAGHPRDTALVIDLKGPEAVAVAAAVATDFAPVFTFDNWPHPRGVVPSHETLAAALYYLPWLQRAAASRSTPAPPAFVLDANRLASYTDEVAHFDNRYTVSLPSASSLKVLGVSRILYVRDGGGTLESDDLNADLAELERAGIEVRQASLADFERDPVSPPARDAGAPATASAHTTSTRSHYHYGGGGSWGYVYFWNQYGWYRPAPPRGPRPAPPPPSHAASYRPVARQTLFSTRAVGGIAGVGKQKPSGFGRVSIRTARGSGAISVSKGRSGSFGRGSSSSGG